MLIGCSLNAHCSLLTAHCSLLTLACTGLTHARTHARTYMHPLVQAAGADAESVMAMLEAMRPEEMLEAAQQARRGGETDGQMDGYVGRHA